MSKKVKKTKKNKYMRNYDGVLIDEKAPFAYEEAFNALRTNIGFCANGEGCSIFGITSAFANSGKSVVTSNVALSFSKLKKKVLIIDCDLRNHTIDQIFDVEAETGLSRFLSEADAKISDCLLSEVYPNLDILPCGQCPPNPMELLASEKMKKLLQMAKETYDYIFLDFPPLLEVSDAGTLASSVTGYIVVTVAGATNTKALKKALGMIEMFNAKTIGVVINGSSPKNRHYYNKNVKHKRYGYGYGERNNA